MGILRGFYAKFCTDRASIHSLAWTSPEQQWFHTWHTWECKMGHTISQHLPTRFWLHALACAPTWGLSGASSIRCTWKRGGFFGLFLYFYVHQFPSPCTGIVSSHDKEQPPPASQPEGQTQLLQTHTFLPSRSCWKALLYSNHHGLWGIWDIQCSQPYPLKPQHELPCNASLLREVRTLPFTREQTHVFCWLQGYKRGYLLLILNF